MVHSREAVAREVALRECAEILVPPDSLSKHEVHAWKTGVRRYRDAIRALLDEPSKNPGELRGPTVGELMGGEYGENKSFAYHPIWDI